MAAKGRPIVRMLMIAAAGAVASLLLSVPARAQETPPGSAVDQYVEQVPSAGGPVAPGVEKRRRSPLPRAGAKALKKAPHETAKALEEIATSSDYGAPQAPRPIEAESLNRPEAKSKKPRPVTTTTSVSRTLQSSVGALGTASDTRLIALLVVLLVCALAAVALAVRRTG